MTSSDTLLLLMGGYLLMDATSIKWGTGWVWPVPTSPDAGPAVISQEFRRPGHLGVDIMFRGATGWYAPPDTPIVAAHHGRVVQVRQTARGWGAVIDHLDGLWMTFYQHMSAVTLGASDAGPWRAGLTVEAGQQIGVMGADPTDPQGLVHLHFATWYLGWGDPASVDPARAMASWPRQIA